MVLSATLSAPLAPQVMDNVTSRHFKTGRLGKVLGHCIPALGIAGVAVAEHLAEASHLEVTGGNLYS